MNKEIVIQNGKYKLTNKLGSGRFSVCWEGAVQTGGSVAVKVQRNKRNNNEMAKDEIKLYELLKSKGECENVLKLLDHFVEMGEICMVFEKMDKTLHDYIKESKTGLSVNETKDIIKQVLNGLAFLSKCGVVHTDLKPENILLKKENDKLHVCICDLGNACLVSDINKFFKLQSDKLVEEYEDLLEDNKVIKYKELSRLKEQTDKEKAEIVRLLKQREVKRYSLLLKQDEIKEFNRLNEIITDNIGTTEYQSIEGIIGAKYGPPTDVWSVACIMFECLTNNYLFDPYAFIDHDMDNYESDSDSDSDSSSSSSSSSSDDNKKILIDQMHLWLMTRTLGDIPRYISRKGDFADDFFNRAGNIKNMPQFLKEKKISYTLQYDYNFEENEAKEIEELLLPMLIYDAEKRISALDAKMMFKS